VYEPQVLVQQGFDWGNQTEYYSHRLVNQFYHYWTVLDDVSGHYDIGPAGFTMRNVDTFGFGYSSWTNELFNWTTAPFGDTALGIPLLSGQPAGTLAVPMNSAAAINAIYVPPASAYSPPSNLGTKSYTEITSIYWQHSIDVVPNWLTLVAGYTWENVATASVSNVSTLPFAAVWQPSAEWLHRLGAVVHLTKSVSLYALDSTSFTPAGSGAILENGQVAPNALGKGEEIGLKALLLGGRLSADFAHFIETSNNADIVGGTLANGLTYVVPIGGTKEEGIDGDIALSLLPGWQLVGSFYAGHDRDQNNNPVTLTYDNSWGVLTRYAFPHSS
jgi:outer membrane receptor for ferric coprogen and ferric-rhodotorulic acid